MSTVRRLYLPAGHVLPGLHHDGQPAHPIELDAEESHYGRHVLRLAGGSAVLLLDGQGRAQAATVAPIGRHGLLATPNGPIFSLAGTGGQRTLVVALPKGERADWLVEKACELGVSSLVWTQFARSHGGPRGSARSGRWQRLARAAGRQAQHGQLMQVDGPLSLTLALDSLAPGTASKWVVHPSEASPLLHVALGRACSAANTIVVVVGPEGGLEPTELQALTARGYSHASLGPHILRLETAAVVAAAACLWASPVPPQTAGLERPRAEWKDVHG